MNRSAVTVGGVVAAFAAVGVVNLARTVAPAADADRAVQVRLDAVPEQIGAWRGAAEPIDPTQLRVAEARAHLSRTYTRDQTGQRVHVLLLAGEPGPLGAHTPDICYGAAGYHTVGAPYRRRVPGGPGEFWSARFENGSYPPAALQVTWGWSAGGPWEAADSPRVRFAAHGGIYKLYLSRAVMPTARPDGPDPSDEFLGPFLTAVTTALAGSPPAAPATPPTDRPPAVAAGASPGGERP